MKTIKKLIISIVIVAMIATISIALVSCNKTDAKEIVVVVPDGAPALALANMMKNGFQYDNYNVKFEIVAGAAEVSAKLTAKQADISILPTNIAAKLYTNNVDIKLVAANIFGVLYIVGTEQITDIADLRGEKILCTGQGGTPEFVLNYLLENAGLSTSDVNIEFIAQGSDAIAALKAKTAKFALLGEPAATMAVNKASATILFDLQQEWKDSTGFDGYPQAGTVASSDLIANHNGFLKAFLKKVQENVTYIAETDVAEINAALLANNSLISFPSTAVIERSNIRYMSGNDVKESLISYFEIMMAKNAQFIGGKLPNEGFYCTISLD